MAFVIKDLKTNLYLNSKYPCFSTVSLLDEMNWSSTMEGAHVFVSYNEADAIVSASQFLPTLRTYLDLTIEDTALESF